MLRPCQQHDACMITEIITHYFHHVWRISDITQDQVMSKMWYDMKLKFPHNFSAEIQKKWRKNVLWEYFHLFSLEIHRGYFHMEISLIFPCKFHKSTYKGTQLWKNIPAMLQCHFFGELKGQQVGGTRHLAAVDFYGPIINTWSN